MKRRQLVKVLSGPALISLAGCVNSRSDRSGGDQQRQTECRMETRERASTVYDDLDIWDAGNSGTWDFDLDKGEQVHVKAVQVEGARPDLEVKDPDGEMLIDTHPAENIERSFTAAQDGTYYVTLTNEAMMTSGRWDVTIEVTQKYQERVCT